MVPPGMPFFFFFSSFSFFLFGTPLFPQNGCSAVTASGFLLTVSFLDFAFPVLARPAFFFFFFFFLFWVTF